LKKIGLQLCDGDITQSREVATYNVLVRLGRSGGKIGPDIILEPSLKELSDCDLPWLDVGAGVQLVK